VKSSSWRQVQSQGTIFLLLPWYRVDGNAFRS
jgi:hypothetical protein